MSVSYLYFPSTDQFGQLFSLCMNSRIQHSAFGCLWKNSMGMWWDRCLFLHKPGQERIAFEFYCVVSFQTVYLLWYIMFINVFKYILCYFMYCTCMVMYFMTQLKFVSWCNNYFILIWLCNFQVLLISSCTKKVNGGPLGMTLSWTAILCIFKRH